MTIEIELNFFLKQKHEYLFKTQIIRITIKL